MSARLAQLQAFRDVPVVPVTSFGRSVGHGGPIWPEFEGQVAARHCRHDSPADRRPISPSRTRPLRRSAVWGGFLIHQFGHLVSEQMTRLPQSLRDRPDDLYLFTVQPGQTAETLPSHIWDVLDWYGVRRRRVRLITRPILSADLRVAAQGETLGRLAPNPEYLDLVDALAMRNALVPARSEIAFVTRAGMLARGMGGHLGETYVAELLTQLGVKVLDPAVAPLRDQLASYAGARVLVFSEGSALHGRGMLGRIDQDIHVLCRRFKHRIGQAQIAPRCRSLHYHVVVEYPLLAVMPEGRPRPDLSAATYDLPVLFDCFARLGLDLAAIWNDEAYRAAQIEDARAWLKTCKLSDEQLHLNIQTLNELGFGIELPPDLLPPNSAPGDRALSQT